MNNRCSQSARYGFTLIELLAAALLTVILMATVARVIRTAAQETRRTRDHSAARQSTWLLKEQIRRDLRNAQGMLIEPHQWRLYGFLASDQVTRMPTHRPAFVVYRVVGGTNRGLLVRDELPVGDGSGPGSPVTTPLWQGVGALHASARLVVDDQVAAFLGSVDATGGLPPMPSTLDVSLLDDSGRLLLSATVEHHRER